MDRDMDTDMAMDMDGYGYGYRYGYGVEMWICVWNLKKNNMELTLYLGVLR